MILLSGKNILRIFYHIKKSNLTCTVAQNGFCLNGLTTFQLYCNRLFVGIILNFIDFGIKSDFSTKRLGAVGKNFWKFAISALNITPITFSVILKFSHNMMKQNITGVMVWNAHVLPDDTISGQGCLQDSALEPWVEKLFDWTCDEFTKIKVIKVGFVNSLKELNFVHEIWRF